jgi:hypothetical protein
MIFDIAGEEIDKLEAEIERLREALEKIANTPTREVDGHICIIARQALNPQDPNA